MNKGKVILFKRKEREKMAVKPINLTTEISDPKVIKEIMNSASKKPSKAAREINRSALKLYKKMYRDE